VVAAGTAPAPRVRAIASGGRCRAGEPPRKPFVPNVIEKQSSSRTNCNSSSKSCGQCGSTPVVAGHPACRRRGQPMERRGDAAARLWTVVGDGVQPPKSPRLSTQLSTPCAWVRRTGTGP
jgi:hypothetical protein